MFNKGERALQEKYGTSKQAYAFYNNQILSYLNDVMIRFIAKQEMVFISTSDSRGRCDSSFRAGLPGFVRVIDSKTLIYPEYRGNGVMASLGNIYENPHIGMMFIDFFDSTVGLHVNGTASIAENNELKHRVHLDPSVEKDIAEKEQDKPQRWVIISVEEAYIHCSKHIPLLQKASKHIDWGTNDISAKGGDFFKIKNEKRAPKSQLP
ncbi:putative pyridoxine 5'-phosphate oxidase superfamily flavin-nucleotide-binding protein [Scopulibacillus daqui]|uniref:Pyridoxine 5'-phosphate oxidase superfamily flavin-nucleotide-binding protein n=1 Tax=Scopulibacillus daqui TaxID=1469162 RepID=A0ABS2Q4C1_9BACL|nr:pyridoxamine 5'-phosphate oxidase family protein [Scopulibacillus daqui]MBM7646795.1 putative pyridoxine 5'-phosphate oxidase superfamily flavin-nucleotide-binding protein [Scopulibacillus daqui]